MQIFENSESGVRFVSVLFCLQFVARKVRRMPSALVVPKSYQREGQPLKTENEFSHDHLTMIHPESDDLGKPSALLLSSPSRQLNKLFQEKGACWVIGITHLQKTTSLSNSNILKHISSLILR